MIQMIDDIIEANNNKYYIHARSFEVTVMKGNQHITFNMEEMEFAQVLITYLNKRKKPMSTEESIQKIPMSKEQAKEFAHALIDKLLEMNEGDEYTSLSFNLTAGPKEGPVVMLCLLPGTTKENAIRIQDGFIANGLALNKGQ